MKNKQTSVLIPEHCDNPIAYYVIRCLKEASDEFRINVIISGDRVSPDNSWLSFYKHSRYVNNLIFSENKMSSVEYLNEVIQIVENTGIDIVFPTSEPSFKFVSKYKDNLSNFCRVVALPSHDAFHTALDKWRFHLFLKKHNIPVPETVLLRETENLSQFNYPVLLKPTSGMGGKNIQKFDTLEKESFQAIFNDSCDYIIQDYIPGYDIDCNVLCREGQLLAYTIQQNLGINGGFAPKIDKLKFVHDPVVMDIVARTMNVLQWNGVAHLDLRYNSETGELNVIEINPRFWQSLIGSLAVGVNFPYLLYLVSNNISFDPVVYEDKYYVKVQRFIRDVLNGSLQYSFSDTNIKFFLSDPNAVIQLMLHQFLRNRVSQKS